MSVPVIFWLLVTGRTQAAFLIFVCAGISDQAGQPRQLSGTVRQQGGQHGPLFVVESGLIEYPSGGGSIVDDEADGALAVVAICGQSLDVDSEGGECLGEGFERVYDRVTSK